VTARGRRLIGIPAAIIIVLTAASTTAAAPVNPAPACKPLTRFERDDFPRRPKVANPWNPLVPGMQLIMEGRANRGGGLLPHRTILTVTDLTKVIDGVRTVVLLDQDYNQGRLSEAELAFHAQDDAGNVWNLGEYPEIYAGGQFRGAPDTWIAGMAGATAGVIMRAHPRLETSSYRQGRAPRIEFYDCASVLRTGQRACVPSRCYDRVLVTDEWSPLDPESGHQRKYYAPGIGNIKITAVGDPEGETLVLVSVAHIGAAALAAARAKALTMDRRAYRVSAVYRQTPPAE